MDQNLRRYFFRDAQTHACRRCLKSSPISSETSPKIVVPNSLHQRREYYLLRGLLDLLTINYLKPAQVLRITAAALFYVTTCDFESLTVNDAKLLPVSALHSFTTPFFFPSRFMGVSRHKFPVLSRNKPTYNSKSLRAVCRAGVSLKFYLPMEWLVNPKFISQFITQTNHIASHSR